MFNNLNLINSEYGAVKTEHLSLFNKSNRMSVFLLNTILKSKKKENMFRNNEV